MSSESRSAPSGDTTDGPKPHGQRDAKVFGQQDNLVGIVRHPTKANSPDDFGVLILTPGMLHNAGPFRLHVDLAEALADFGLPSLRFDLSGIGESLAVGNQGDSLQRAASEIGQAIDMLERDYGIRRVAIFGLCSGADDGFNAAVHDDRIVGLFLLDGCGYRTRKYYWHRLVKHYLRKALSLRSWIRIFERQCLRKSAPATLQLGTDIREFPSQPVAAAQLQQLVDRSVRIHFHYTGGVKEYYNHAEQFDDMFPGVCGNGLVSSTYRPEADHVAYLCEHRQELVTAVAQRMLEIAGNLPQEQASQDCEKTTPLFPGGLDTMSFACSASAFSGT